MSRVYMNVFGILLILTQIFIDGQCGVGENPMDLQTFAGIINGIGYVMEHPIDTIEIPADLFMGKWYQIYKEAINFDVYRTQMYCPISYFKPNSVMGEDGFSIEEAYRVSSKNGPIDTFKRDLNKVGPGKYWMYTEEYFYPKQFYIVKAGPKYNNETVDSVDIQYLVVTDGSRLTLMVYARDPQTYFQKYNKEVVEFLEKAGFGGKVFWNKPKPLYQGPDCEWPSEREVFMRRSLKNYEINRKAANTTEPSPSAIADLFKNPHLALQKLVQMHKK